MALQKYVPSGDGPSLSMKSLSFSSKAIEKAQPLDSQRKDVKADVDVDIREIYFLIMHFLSSGPCQRTCGQFWNELLEHQLLPRRYHAWYSRGGDHSGNEDDDGMSLPLSYIKLVERYPHIEKDHLVKLLKQLLLDAAVPGKGLLGGNALSAASVPTLLGSGSFSLLSSEDTKSNNEINHPPRYTRWPHMLADQVRGLSLREIGGGFSRHHRAPSIRAACFAIAKPSTLVKTMKKRTRVRGHRYAVYCAIFDRSGRYVITGSDDRLVKIWSMETAYCLASCRGHEGDITDLAVNFNNTLVASASNDCVIRVWRLNDGMPISVLRGHTGAVTAIAFSPRPSAVYQLLSSSDDGTCRIWDVRHSQLNPRVYVPKPSDSAIGKSNGPSSSSVQQSHQIFCCAFNASGTVFVTGSSDTLARVWNACKYSTEDSEQPNHEMDILSGHENDVNYVQFSGCAVTSRYSSSDVLKEDNLPKFKNTWFNQDNIVTCSRDGSAIIWIPRSRRSHGKVGRWTRAYHLKVPPPPMPPQPPRGGPRQRVLPTPRGVNMIIWSLDNRFVLAAIMDCRICVWNASDGSLVHSLTGHTDSTYVLDVHPFNPRIAMSAGYDGRTIVWDIWEGTPVHTYEIGRFKLVDGKFSPDGTSIVLSDDVGQLYILSMGEGEDQTDAKYDQFFLGDYRPLVQDTHGNVLDQETQLVPYRRNMQDLLCDAGMIPYPEPYQSMYQRRRLGVLGIEWRPSSIRFAVGPDITLGQEYQMPPIADLDILIDPLPEFVDAMDWEPEIDMRSEDNDSEYHVTEEYSSAGEQGSLNSCSSGDPESSGNDSEPETSHRKSKRKKQKAEIEVTTSSGRRVKRKNLDEYDGESSLVHNRRRKFKNGRKASRKKSSSSKSLRPQRAAARNALNLFSRITGASTDGEDEYSTEGDSSESESVLEVSNVVSEESELSLQHEEREPLKGKEILVEKSEDIERLDRQSEFQIDTGPKRRLVLKLPNRDLGKFMSARNSVLKGENQLSLVGSSSVGAQQAANVKNNYSWDMGKSADEANGDKMAGSQMVSTSKCQYYPDLLEGCKDRNISWGGVKARTSKRLRTGESLTPAAFPDGYDGPDNCRNGHIAESETNFSAPEVQNGDMVNETLQRNEPFVVPRTIERAENIDASCLGDAKDFESPAQLHQVDGGRPVPSSVSPGGKDVGQFKPSIIPTKLRIKSRLFASDCEGTSKEAAVSPREDLKQNACGTLFESLDLKNNFDSCVPNSDEAEIPKSDNGSQDGMQESNTHSVKSPGSALLDFQQLPPQNRTFNAVYRRSKSFKGRNNEEADNGGNETSTSAPSNHNLNDRNEAATEGLRRTRSIRLRSTNRDSNISGSNFNYRDIHNGSIEAQNCTVKTSVNKDAEVSSEEWRAGPSVAVGLRSTRNRRGTAYVRDCSPPQRKKLSQSARNSWLMLSRHEEGSRYIPQKGDEVVYLRQGHQEYIAHSKSRERGPWNAFKVSIRDVEFCKVEELEYATHTGSGESCCKMTLRFVDPSSSVAGRSFNLTLPEVSGFPDFLVERNRYEAAIARKWTNRDKCRVWWKNEGEDNGSWWEGRIVTVKAKSSEYPDSPWERYAVQYKSDPRETHLHSPWELYDPEDTHWEQPQIDEEVRMKLLYAFSKLEQSGSKSQDYYGVQKMNDLTQKASFINRFPVPLCLEVIQSRLENNYYRSLEALKHDIQVMLSILDTYIGRNAEASAKLKRLSDWFTKTLSSSSL